MHILSKFLPLAAISLLLFCASCQKSQDQVHQGEKGESPKISKKIEGENVPRDAFHGFAPGKSSPRDPDFHKGSFLDEKVGLKKEENVSELEKIKTPDDMISAFSKILLTDPENISAWIMVGSGHALKGEHKEAIKNYKKSIGLKETADAYSNMAFSYSDLGDNDEALENHKKALALDPEMANSYFGLALIFENRKDYPNALVNWEMFVEKEGKKKLKDNKKIKKVQKRIDLLKNALAKK